MNNNYCPIPGASQPKEQPQTIVERIGEPAFLEQLAEECSELAQAALKSARKYRGENPTPKTIDECYDALQEEIADVMLCVSEYLDCKGPDYLNCVMLTKLKKHERWERRLKEVGK
nr:MAG TPA: NTP-PPase-like protein [Caudoviricetes sp.]DAU21457.1 MAG TPA: NTP-PPase-like protein [Caudoviricetes sp.]